MEGDGTSIGIKWIIAMIIIMLAQIKAELPQIPDQIIPTRPNTNN
jgi:hypothetical protein